MATFLSDQHLLGWKLKLEQVLLHSEGCKLERDRMVESSEVEFEYPLSTDHG